MGDRTQPLPSMAGLEGPDLGLGLGREREGLRGLGLFGIDLPDWIEKPAEWVADGAAAVATGGASLLLPDSFSPGQIVAHPLTTAESVVGVLGNIGNFKDLAKKLGAGAGQILGTGLKGAGGGFNPAAAAGASAASSTTMAKVKKYAPYVVGGVAVLAIGYMVFSRRRQ